MIQNELLRVLPSLTDPFILVGVERTGLLDEIHFYTEVKNLSPHRDTLSIEHVNHAGAERRCNLILHNFDLRPVSDDFLTLLERIALSDVNPDRGIEFQCLAAGRGLRIAVEYPNLLAQLVDEDDYGVGFADHRGEFPEGLAHQPGLQANVTVSHVALDLSLGG